MEKSSTTGALFCSYRALYDDMYAGNEETLGIAKSHKGLVPLAVINHLHFDTSTDYLARLKKMGAKGFLFAPSLQYGSTKPVNFRLGVQRAAKIGLPLQIAIASPEEFSDAFEATKGTQVPVLIRTLGGGAYKLMTDFIAAARERKNLYFDVGSIVPNGGIAYLAKVIGLQRLYFSSNAPANIERSTHLLIEAAPDLTEKEKKQILSGNLSRLFLKKSAAGTLRMRDEDLQELSRPKIDTHWHSDGWDILEPAKGLENISRFIDRFGYRAVCVSSITALNYDLEQGNERLLEAINKDSRLFAYIVIDPLRIDQSLELLSRYASHPKVVGLKTIQDHYDLKLDDPQYAPLLEWASKNRFPVMAHLRGMGNAARRFRDVQFIAAHSTLGRIHQLADVEGKIPNNIYFDIAVSHSSRSETNLKGLAKAVGANRILYSADGPLMSPAWTIGKVIDAGFDAATKDKIYLRNALTLLPKLESAIS